MSSEELHKRFSPSPTASTCLFGSFRVEKMIRFLAVSEWQTQELCHSAILMYNTSFLLFLHMSNQGTVFEG